MAEPHPHDPVVLRPATGTDTEFLRQMLFEAWRWDATWARTEFEAWREQNPANGYVSDFGARSGDRGVIAEIGGIAVGAAWFRFLRADGPGSGYVAEEIPELAMAVTRAFRGRGIGRRLLAALLDGTHGGPSAVSLHVDRDNIAARRIYAAAGFRTVREADNGSVMLFDLR